MGKLYLPHGKVETPAFLPVATRGIVKLLDFEDMKEMGTQMLMANLYHLYLRPGVEVIEEFGGINKFTGWNKPFMTDSGGFQAFSLGIGSILGSRKFEYENEQQIRSTPKKEKVRAMVKEDYVEFRSVYDGSKHRLTPEKVIEIQERIGADIIFVLDECTPPSADYEYTQKSMERTHEWAKRSLKVHNTNQALFGIVQGGLYKDLRIESAKTIANMEVNGKTFDGIGIGGAFGKDQMYQTLEWIMPLLPEEKPVHLLGVGTVRDIFESVKRGIDLFDCVGPQRIGRAGYFYISPENGGSVKNKFRDHITSAKFEKDNSPLDPSCQCKVCKNYSRAFIHHLFKAEPLSAMRLVSYHNVHFIVNLMKKIRKAIINNEFEELYHEWIK